MKGGQQADHRRKGQDLPVHWGSFCGDKTYLCTGVVFAVIRPTCALG